MTYVILCYRCPDFYISNLIFIPQQNIKPILYIIYQWWVSQHKIFRNENYQLLCNHIYVKVYQRNGKLLKMVCLEVTRYIKMQNLFWAANVLPSKKTGTFKQFIHINSYLRLKYLVEYRTRHHRDMICVQMNNIFTSFWLRFYIQFMIIQPYIR